MVFRVTSICARVKGLLPDLAALTTLVADPTTTRLHLGAVLFTI